jgi:hypothetical protein
MFLALFPPKPSDSDPVPNYVGSGSRKKNTSEYGAYKGIVPSSYGSASQ